MSQNYSDYQSPFNVSTADVMDSPERNPLQEALASSLFDRFYTQPETQRVIGTVGQLPSGSTTNNLVPADNTFDQAYQLQPIIQTEVGSETLFYSYEDLLSRCQQLGISEDTVQEWQNTQAFNFALPIDFDKYINYTNYYWLDGVDLPEYVVIRNPQVVLQSQVAQMVAHYVDLLGNGDVTRLTLWDSIAEGLDYINTQVAVGDQITIPNIDTALNDPIHATYVVTPRSDPKYDLNNEWQTTNKWVHRMHVIDITNATRGAMPILEYDNLLQMTAWTYTTSIWMYRPNTIVAFAPTTAQPTDAELFNRFPLVAVDSDANSFTIAGDQSALFTVGQQFSIELSTTYKGSWIPSSIVVENDQTTLFVNTNVIPGIAAGNVVPFTKTSLGDTWSAFTDQWMYVRSAPSLPTTPPLQLVAPVIHSTTVGNGQTVFDLPFSFIVGGNAVAVYVDGIRQYGNYDETSSTQITIAGLTAGQSIEFMLVAQTANDVLRQGVNVRTFTTDGSTLIEPQCLVVYRETEQRRTGFNEYPLFDIVNPDGSTRFMSSSLVTFEESSTEPIFPIFGKRLVYDASTKDFTMSIDAANGELYCYKQNGLVTSVWYPVTAPAIPVRVDSTGTPTTDGSGVWQIPEQFTNNLSHELRTSLKFSELYAHFRSIESAQIPPDPTLYGALDTISGYHIMDVADMGVGGSIKEHNDSFDTFVSTLITSDYEYSSVINFARDEYRELLVDYFNRIQTALTDALLTNDPASIQDPATYVSSQTISDIETDANLYRLYGDSTVGLKYGSIKNFIATLPYFGYVDPVQPEVLIDNRRNIFQVVHHDGHRALDELNGTAMSSMTAHIVNSLQLTGSTKPLTPSAAIKIGQVYYDPIADELYRLAVVGVGPQAPLLSLYTDGAFWINTTNNQLYQIQNGMWVFYSTTLDDAWQVLDLTNIVLTSVLSIEQSLYEGATKVTPSAFRIDELSGDGFDAQRQTQFESWCKSNNITSPYTGDYVASNPFTWNYSQIVTSLFHNVTTTPLIFAPRADRLMELNYGTAYPQLQPWVLQGYGSKPAWWDNEYAGTTRRWSTTMWTNVMAGIVPAGQLLSDGTVAAGAAGEAKTWTRVSVNITDSTTADGYGPDDQLPPYWVPTVSGDNLPGIVDQVMLDCIPQYLFGISNNTYTFGEYGPNEYNWVNSVDYLYDLFEAYYLIQPIQTVHRTFGEVYDTVNSLDIAHRTQRVYSHTDVQFHGDVDDSGTLVLLDGVNQWYTQFFRYINLDTNSTSYKDVWKDWVLHLAYNVGAFLIDNTLSISSSQIEVAPNDYSVAFKVNKRVSDKWIDALYIDVNQNGSIKELTYGSGRDWKFNVSIHNPSSRQISYYGVKKHQITFSVADDVITITDGGTLSDLGWTTGSGIVFDTGINGVLPSNIDDMVYYYVIAISDTTFQVSASVDGAAAHNAVIVGSAGSGTLYVGQLASTFYAFSQKNSPGVWRHFASNGNLLTFTDTMTVTGIQNLIDVIDGYQASLIEQGFVFNQNSAIEYDAVNNRQLNWQYEIERVIDTMYLTAKGRPTSVANALGTLDINPFRNHLWISTPSGVVSSFDASDSSQTSYRAIIFNSTGQMVSTKNYNVFRQDLLTHIATVDPVSFVNGITSNDFATIQYLTDNIGGVHAYFDEYEHIVVFSDYAISGDLIFDGFLGIQTPRFSVYYEKQIGNTSRPNIGGYVLNSDGTMSQNMEYTVSNITKYYDTFTVNENSNFVNYARALLGYTPNVSYMQEVGATPKSQFLFYKGMIQNKGTMRSMTAFTNNINLNAAQIDEFWAYKAFEFGQNAIKVSYLINLFPTDTARSHLKFQFTTSADTVEEYFEEITANDSTRWLEYPNQRAAIIADSNVSFETKIDGVDQATILTAIGSISGPYIKHAAAVAVDVISTDIERATIPSNGNEVITLPFTYVMGVGSLVVYVNGNLTTEFTEVSGTSIDVPGSVGTTLIVARKAATLIEGTHYKRINNRIVQFLIDPSQLGAFEVVRYSANVERNVPISLLDTKSNTTVVDMVTWDPVNGVYTDEVALAVDVTSNTDPAVYNSIPDASRLNINYFWNTPEQGTVWLDTLSYKFVRYDDNVSQDTNTRLLNWGRMEEWSEPTMYAWIGTTTAPLDWTDGTPYQEVYSRSRAVGTLTIPTGGNSVGTITGVEVADQTEVIFVQPTAPLLPEIIYSLAAVGSGFNVVDSNGIIQTLPDGYTVTILKAAFDATWTTVPRLQVTLECVEVDQTSGLIQTGFGSALEYALYVDGTFAEDGYTNDDGSIVLQDTTIAMFVDNPASMQMTINNKTGVIDGLSTTVPDDYELTGLTAQEYVGTPMASIVQYDETSGVARNMYYYWVTGSSVTVGNDGYTTGQLEAFVNTYTKPFVSFAKPELRAGEHVLTQLIADGISGLVTDEDRYVLRLVRDDTLRDRSYLDSSGRLLRPIYAEWTMFRQNQDSNITERLWDLITESIVGYKLSDGTTPVPALDRVVYDKLNGTNTRFGMNVGQAFTDGGQAINTIYAVLNDPTIDYSPNDVDLFLQTHDMTTNANVIQFMDDLYKTFDPSKVNGIFFAVMEDALSIVGGDYATNLMKTSGIAVTSSMPLNVNGALDG